MRLKLFALPILAAIAAPAFAVQSVTITSTGIYNPGSVLADVAGTTKSEYAVPLTFTAASGKADYDFLGFCIDLPHEIYVAVGSQLKQTLDYHVAALTADGYGNALSTGQVRAITGLADLGFGIAKGNATDKAAQLAAVQQAIWTVEYPTATFTPTGPYAATQASYAAAFVTESAHLSGFARTIVADSGNTQAQITNIGGVPEPAVWVELIAGFGLAGLVARRRATGLTVAA